MNVAKRTSNYSEVFALNIQFVSLGFNLSKTQTSVSLELNNHIRNIFDICGKM